MEDAPKTQAPPEPSLEEIAAQQTQRANDLQNAVVTFKDAMDRGYAYSSVLPPGRAQAIARTKIDEARLWGEQAIRDRAKELGLKVSVTLVPA